MNEFRDYLERYSMADRWSPRERSEILQMVYSTLRCAVRDGCDALAVTPEAVTWSRHGEPMGRASVTIGGVPYTPSYREMLRIVLARDAMVRGHVRPVSEGPVEAVYRLAAPAQTSVGSTAASPMPGGASGAGITPVYGVPRRAPSDTRGESAPGSERERSMPPPYELAVLLRASRAGLALLVNRGIARTDFWMAHADPAASYGLEDVGESGGDDAGALSADELLRQAALVLADCQRFVDRHPEALQDGLRVSRIGPSSTDPRNDYVYFTGQGLRDGDIVSVLPEQYAALARPGDRFLAVRLDPDAAYAETYAGVFVAVVRQGTAMAAILALTNMLTSLAGGESPVPSVRSP
ncbi:MAG TPA: hypothetical protein VFW96_23185 [Thermomicrobiales bacterium]|nr:hypothetical protein [Thermomicrobiales bacterium]